MNEKKQVEQVTPKKHFRFTFRVRAVLLIYSVYFRRFLFVFGFYCFKFRFHSF